MKSFDEAERLISAVDAEDINRITGKLAPALDGHGDDIKKFLERADSVVTDVNQRPSHHVGDPETRRRGPGDDRRHRA